VLGVLEVEEPELMPPAPVVPPMPEPVVPAVPPAPAVVSVEEPPAPIEVPPPVEPVVEPAPAVVSVLPVPPVLGVVLAVPLPVSLGELVVEEVLEEPEPAPASFFLPQAVRDRAAMRARAAHCAIGDLIIRNS
jgi:hypothetical protein